MSKINPVLETKDNLLLACQSYNIKLVEKLLKEGNDPNISIDGLYPIEGLVLVIDKDRLEEFEKVLRLLIKYKAKTNIRKSIYFPQTGPLMKELLESTSIISHAEREFKKLLDKLMMVGKCDYGY